MIYIAAVVVAVALGCLTIIVAVMTGRFIIQVLTDMWKAYKERQGRI